ncbi:MAG: PAS domain-containing protein [Candidatus Eisenbacteria bacterium]|uniref:histidine kinase n=1 Tax=Eiseniibacteriota bacterium TaxID=2212470 RepID=A0A948RW91_UNCEI|nr:PAS domain-containing protein [Candidatus Eisenbacteria bacterium]MBU1950932.1 PAS domain-containing protein [Candidatus Eisenbacteria bacterium]MBU2692195.1 PAS domain-containing protein [Candidatus Eisenbacteria bacterium]
MSENGHQRSGRVSSLREQKGLESPAQRLAASLNAESLVLIILTETGISYRAVRYGSLEWPAESISMWLRKRQTWTLPVHTLLEPANLESARGWSLPAGTQMVLLGNEHLSSCFLFVPNLRRPAGLGMEALALAHAMVRSERLADLLDLERIFSAGITRVLEQGMMTVDEQGRIVRCDERAGEILGLSVDQIIGRLCDDILKPADFSESPLRSILNAPVARIDLYILHSEGREIPVSIRLSQLLDDEGRVRGAVALFRDISGDRALEENARRRDRLASIGELAAGVAHEIRNPLTGIINCGQVLRDRLGEEHESARLINLILREGDRLNRLVSSMLDFAQPGPPQMRLSRIEECLDRVLELEEDHLVGRSIEIVKQFQPDLPAIYMDADQITQVFMNLIRNARQAMPQGGELKVEVHLIRRHPHLRKGLGRRAGDRVRVSRETPLRPFLQVRIVDTGPGIPEEVLSKIFDPFFTTRSDGTGLGLCITQSIVQEHGGSISIQSVPGRGATVEVDLPVERRYGERRRESN